MPPSASQNKGHPFTFFDSSAAVTWMRLILILLIFFINLLKLERTTLNLNNLAFFNFLKCQTVYVKCLFIMYIFMININDKLINRV